jgi:hypothetical protein
VIGTREQQENLDRTKWGSATIEAIKRCGAPLIAMVEDSKKWSIVVFASKRHAHFLYSFELFNAILLHFVARFILCRRIFKMAAVPRDFFGVWAIKSLNATPCVKLSILNKNKPRRASNLRRAFSSNI